MDAAMRHPGIMDHYPPHYPPYQAGLTPWGMMPGFPVPQDYRHTVENFSTNLRTSQTSQNSKKLSSSLKAGEPVSPPPSRERFSYTRYQLELLNMIFLRIRFPNSMQKQLIAKRVGIKREQVKVWFQNRRRKDVTGKASKSDDTTTGPAQVPDGIIDGVLQELLKYENEPKGKKIANSQKEYDKKVTAQKRGRESRDSNDHAPTKRQRQQSGKSRRSSVSNTSIHSNSINNCSINNNNNSSMNNSLHGHNASSIINVSSLSHTSGISQPSVPHDIEIHFANEPSPNISVGTDCHMFGFNRESPQSHSSEGTGPSSDRSSSRTNSLESCGKSVHSPPQTPFSTDGSTDNVTSPLPLTVALSAQQLDMNSPPNAVALPPDKATLERPRSLESPLDYHVDGATYDSHAEDTDGNIGLKAIPIREKEVRSTEKPPPNTVAPPSAKLNFDASYFAKKATPIPVGLIFPNKNNHDQTHFPSSQIQYAHSDNLTTPTPVQPFSSSFPQWNHHYGGYPDKTRLNQQQYNTVTQPAEARGLYVDPLSSHYDKLYAPFPYGFYSDHNGLLGHAPQPTIPPFMLPHYATPFSYCDAPSDLSTKKHH